LSLPAGIHAAGSVSVQLAINAAWMRVECQVSRPYCCPAAAYADFFNRMGRSLYPPKGDVPGYRKIFSLYEFFQVSNEPWTESLPQTGGRVQSKIPREPAIGFLGDPSCESKKPYFRVYCVPLTVSVL
jgi:hypothetical protein